jgi:hypothetical protein
MTSPRPPDLLPGQADRIDPLCDEFELAWIEGRRPRLEEFLPRAQEQDREALLRELLALEVEYRFRQQERVTLEEFRHRLPGYTRVLFQALGEPAGLRPSSSFTARDRPAPGVSPGQRYQIESLLGQGGMGTVYRAHDRKLDRRVALKVIRPGAMTPAMRARFEGEARAVARLDHPHIVKIFDVGEMPAPDGGGTVPYLALEYVAGGSLGDRLAGPLDPAEAARLVALLARAIQHAHDRGIVHRDLKPDNVLLADRSDVAALNTALGCPKITDFGLAPRLESEPGPNTGTLVLGTPAYLTPEQARGSPDVGTPADVYALGVILYHLLTGRRPFEADSLTDLLDLVRNHPPLPLRQIRSAIPQELECLCLACLDKQPENRPGAAELAERLEPFAAPGSQTGRPGNGPGESNREPRPAGRAVRLLPLRVALVGLLAAGLLCAALMLAGPGRIWNPARDAPGAGSMEQPAVRPAEPLRVARLEVTYFATLHNGLDEPRGVLGKKVFTARRDDSVEVEVELSRPGFAWLIAYRPDGMEELCFPECNPPERLFATVDLLTTPVQIQAAPPWLQALHAERWRQASGELIAPPLSDRPRYPSKSRGVNYGLNEGTGMQAFVVVASSRPLPPYQLQVERRGKAPWGSFRTPPGVVWQDAGGPVEALTEWGLERSERGAGREVPGKRELVRLTDWLRSQPEVEAVQAVAFAVQERR